MNETTDRPALDTGRDHDAVAGLLEHLQHGHDTGNADTYDLTFADDVLWGSPKGEVLNGFEALNAIHRSFMHGTPAEPRSVFELAQVVAPSAGVVVAQIARRAITGGLSEMAMYVLVERDGQWWVAAGQNTPIADVLPD
ncbi:SgcJ/EcaC family oxidoreductase [Williamsia sp.]|uniref:SgcJ/EcaC family oxidoreductase n=1 Tax=Williamsia sp. TaxID=1872085 RepID=UPI001A2733A4|nr:SgcJ/EcaC family oxidoreductase [Williamsia sp.]MBJ7289677.1 SgcJ/EcaC family oxidoreductase [Williamsia sp.]